MRVARNMPLKSARPYEFVDRHTKFKNLFLVSKLRHEQCNKTHHLTEIITLDNILYEIRRVSLLKYVFHQQLLQHTLLLKVTTTRFSYQLWFDSRTDDSSSWLSLLYDD